MAPSRALFSPSRERRNAKTAKGAKDARALEDRRKFSRRSTFTVEPDLLQGHHAGSGCAMGGAGDASALAPLAALVFALALAGRRRKVAR